MQQSSRTLFAQIHTQLRSIYEADEARSIAFLLLEHCFHVNKTAILADKQIEIPDIHSLNKLVERLLQHEPIQYVLGRTQFYGRWFEVNPSVLIPRPETEELVEWVIKDYASRKAEKLRIIDIGTGSGCIAISLAAAFPNAQVWAIDISENALQVARLNAENNNVVINFIEADILKSSVQLISPDLRYNIIVSNPPYVTYAEEMLMHKNVLDYEPHLALFVSNDDPLLFYRHIAQFSASELLPGGTCYLESNEQYTQAVNDLFILNKFIQAEIKKDMFGKNRFIKAIK